MTEKHEVEIWVAVNEDGDAEAASDEDTIIERFDDNLGGQYRRMIKLTLLVTLPKATELPTIDVPDDDTSAQAKLG